MIIYEANETDFFSNGLGTLPDATSALVTEERNGEFVLDVVYPQQGIRSELLTKNRIIKADAGHELKDQRFVIKKVTPTMDSDGYIYLTVHAEHVSYITADLGVTPNLTLSGNATQALEQWQANLVGGHPDITVDSDIISEHETSLDIAKATNARQVLGGVEGSILDTWGGEYKFDNLHISLRGQRGTTANTLISYGRNLLTFEQEDDITDTYTSIYPYANVGLADGNSSKLVTVDGYFVDSQYVDRYPNRKLFPVDFGSQFTDYKIGSKPSESDTGVYTTEAEIKKKLTELAKQYIENNRIGIPKVSTKITFADLSKTSEYAPLEQVNLCDIIPIRFEMLGIDTTIKVTRVVWNALLDEYDSIELGDLRATLGESISALESKTTGLANAVITAQSTADNQNSIFRTNGGTAEPVAKKVGDLWFKTDGDYQYMYQWDGAVWHEVVNTKTTDDIAKEVDKAKADTEALSSEVELAKKQAQEAFVKAGFNADEISNVKTATSEVAETLTSTIRQTSELSESLKNVASETASQYSEVSSELSNTRDSLTAKASELASEVASNSESITKVNSQLYSQSEGLAKVSQSAAKMEQTMTDLSGRVNTVETTASETKEALADAEGNITTLTKRADGTDTKIADAQGRVQTLESRADNWDLELSKKVDNTTYNAGIQNLGSQINLKANKTDLDGYATKAQLSVESDKIAQQASAISSVTTIANGANDKIDGLRIGGRNLLKNSQGRFQPNGSKLDNWAIYKDTTAYLENGKTYTISAKAKDGLVFSNVHEPTKQSDKIVLWMVDTAWKYNIIVSDDRVSTVGTTFTWNSPTGTYQLRVNTYNADNSGYAEHVQIQEGTRATEWQPSDLDLPDTIVSTVTTTSNAKQIVDSSGIYSEVTKLVDTKVGGVTTQLDSYKHTVDDTGDKLRDVMGALKLDSNGNLTSNFNELIKTASGVEERYTQLNGKIDGLGGGVNLVPSSGKPTDTAHSHWSGSVVYPHAFWKNGKENVFVINNSDTKYEKTASSDWITVERGETYTVSFWACMSSNCSNYDLLFLGRKKGETESFTQIRQIVATQRVSGAMFEYRKFTFNVGQSDEGYLRFDNNSSTDGNNSAFLFTYVKMEKGTVATPWTPAFEDISTEITKTNDTIKTVDGNVTTVKNNLDKTKSVVSQLANLFDVTVGDSSISVTNGGVLVKGKQISIDGDTYIKDASIDGAKIKSLDAGKITTGTLNAANLNVINMNANSIKTGTLSGNNLSLNLDDGTVSFKKGKIVSSNNKLILNIDDGSLAVGDASQRQGMMFNQGKMYLYDQGYFGDSTWNGNVYDWMLEMKKHPYAVLEYNSSLQGAGDSLFGESGANLHSTSGVGIAYDKDISKPTFVGGGSLDDWSPLNGHGVFINENGIAMGAQNKLVSIAGGTSFDYGKYDIFYKQPTILIGTNLWTDNLYDAGYNVDKKISNGSNVYIQASALITDTNTALFRVEDGNVEFAIKGNDRNFIIDASSHTSNGLIVKGSQNVTNWLGCQDLTVRGAKNAVVQTTAGWTKINAYETAEYYFGDLGTAVTDDASTVRIGIEPLFNETVNTNIPYQVFVTSYGKGYAWVAERGSNYFVIKSSTPNLEIGYEVKAKRKGYENVRLEIDKHMEVNK
ncbi:phage tail spike protein [Ligilactobacillus agilis]|uniref:phage tail spike protein n=1 Tax=Ligilactobacillus agilis TaxID=1601 RepID=UPI00067E8579|nr:phage tail spike protein [Ligilactobacillus agilis]